MGSQERARFGRREALQIGLVSLGGWAASRVLLQDVPIGRDVSGSWAAQAMAASGPYPVVGPADAEITMAILTDYRCPVCRISAPIVERAVKRDGHVKLVYRDWPIFGSVSERAARTALAAQAQGIYHRLHRSMMAAPSLDESKLPGLVEEAGGDWDKLSDELASGRLRIQTLLDETAKGAFALGIAGTPAFVMGGRLIVGMLDEDQLYEAFALVRR